MQEKNDGQSMKLSHRRVLLQLAAISVWRMPGGSGFVSKNWYQVLFSDNRRVIIRLIRSWTCCCCGERLPENSTGDHILARANGGTDSLSNFLPLCPPCNSSKGSKDLLVWWRSAGRKLNSLSVDVICAYARIRFKFLHDAKLLDEPADPLAVALVDEAIQCLPQAKQTLILNIGGPKADLKV